MTTQSTSTPHTTPSAPPIAQSGRAATTADRPSDQRPARPVTSAVRLRTVGLAPLLRLGVEGMLARHAHRVELCDGDGSSADVLLLDPTALRGPRQRWPAPAVALVWEDHTRSRRLAQALGAVRVLPVTVASLDLVRVVEQVHRASVGGPEPLLTRDLDGAPPVTGHAPRPGALSPRETEILDRICRGMSNDEIAAELYLSINSVKTYIRTAYRKMGVGRRAQAVLWGIDHGLGT